LAAVRLLRHLKMLRHLRSQLLPRLRRQRLRDILHHSLHEHLRPHLLLVIEDVLYSQSDSLRVPIRVFPLVLQLRDVRGDMRLVVVLRIHVDRLPFEHFRPFFVWPFRSVDIGRFRHDVLEIDIELFRQ
jgi:hypothetical protein